MSKKVCTFFEPAVFTAFMTALRPFAKSERTNYILVESDGNAVVGYACDNHRLATQVYSGPADIDAPFKAYISPLRINPNRDDGPVSIILDGDYAIVHFNGVELRTHQPEAPMDFVKARDSLSTEVASSITVNRMYLRDAVQSLYIPGHGRDYVRLSIAGPLKHLLLTNGANERYILPVRDRTNF